MDPNPERKREELQALLWGARGRFEAAEEDVLLKARVRTEPRDLWNDDRPELDSSANAKIIDQIVSSAHNHLYPPGSRRDLSISDYHANFFNYSAHLVSGVRELLRKPELSEQELEAVNDGLTMIESLAGGDYVNADELLIKSLDSRLAGLNEIVEDGLFDNLGQMLGEAQELNIRIALGSLLGLPHYLRDATTRELVNLAIAAEHISEAADPEEPGKVSVSRALENFPETSALYKNVTAFFDLIKNLIYEFSALVIVREINKFDGA